MTRVPTPLSKKRRLSRGPMHTVNHDVLLIGGGGAGLRAAIAVAEANSELSVAGGL